MTLQESIRRKKLEQIQKLGIEAYPARTGRNLSCAQVKTDFQKLAKAKKNVVLAGRLVLVRGHGGATFVHLNDGTDKFQILFRKDVIGEKEYIFFKDLIDIGDFIEAEGVLFTTKTGEPTLEVKKFKLLTKSLLPLPEKWHGLTDIETRFRQRYLDLIANPEVKKIFKKRSLLIKIIREFFDKRGFLEVETPILQSVPGGANARPFITHHNALDIDLYLRIAPELYLKRLIIGGFEKVYEISRCFRNEGIDRAHNPEFTQIEFYQAYADYNDLMKLTEDFMEFVVKKICGKLTIEYNGSTSSSRDKTSSPRKINFKPPYPRITYVEALNKFAGIDLEKLKTREMLLTKAKNIGLEVESNWSRGKIIDEIFKELVRPKLINPTFIIDHPIELSPLAKKKIDNPDYVERFQLLVAGMEICNTFSELNDPIDQEKRFREQERARASGEEEAQRLDKDFVEALKYGMPPTAGQGIGIDRLAAILFDVHNIKEVILFPTMKPK